MKLSSALSALTATAAAAALVVPPATAAPATPETLASGLVGPLHLDVNAKGRILVSQSFAGLVSRVHPDGTIRNLVKQHGFVGGVAARKGRMAFTYSNESGVSKLKVRRADGSVRVVADLGAFEAEHNPDSKRTYGFLDLAPECASQLPPDVPGGEPYTGIAESNPYALANAPGGGWYVTDAGGNDVLRVSPNGAIKVVYVTRPQRTVITAEAAESLGLPACTVGETYAFEGVPTDVEVSRRGRLFVSLLPGGPESPALGARGKVLKVDPRTGRSRVAASGLVSATNVALAPRGRMFVAELFANKVTAVNLRTGQKRTALRAPLPAAVEYAGGRLVVAVNVLPPEDGPPDGQIVVARR